eukprot:308739-Chlamydomonas_euryale.AAC.1
MNLKAAAEAARLAAEQAAPVHSANEWGIEVSPTEPPAAGPSTAAVASLPGAGGLQLAEGIEFSMPEQVGRGAVTHAFRTCHNCLGLAQAGLTRSICYAGHNRHSRHAMPATTTTTSTLCRPQPPQLPRYAGHNRHNRHAMPATPATTSTHASPEHVHHAYCLRPPSPC